MNGIDCDVTAEQSDVLCSSLPRCLGEVVTFPMVFVLVLRVRFPVSTFIWLFSCWKYQWSMPGHSVTLLRMRFSLEVPALSGVIGEKTETSRSRQPEAGDLTDGDPFSVAVSGVMGEKTEICLSRHSLFARVGSSCLFGIASCRRVLFGISGTGGGPSSSPWDPLRWKVLIVVIVLERDSKGERR